MYAYRLRELTTKVSSAKNDKPPVDSAHIGVAEVACSQMQHREEPPTGY